MDKKDKKEIDGLMDEVFELVTDVLSASKDYSDPDLIIAITVTYMYKRLKKNYKDKPEMFKFIEGISKDMFNKFLEEGES